jgi:transposase
MGNSAMRLYVGVDWAKRKHDAELVIRGGEEDEVVRHFDFTHDDKGFEKFHRMIAETGFAPDSVWVAIETPHGSIVASCLLHGYRVFVLNPKQLDRFRDRYFLSGAKDDRRDAHALASALRTDPKAFREAKPTSESHRVLEQVLKLHNDLVQQRTKLLNQLGELLHEYFPQFEAACGDLDASWVLELWEEISTQSIAQTVKEEKVAAVLKKFHVRTLDAKQLLSQLQTKPIPLLPGVEKACKMHVAVLVEQLNLLKKQLRATDRELVKFINIIRSTSSTSTAGSAPLSDIDIIESLPGAGAYVTGAFVVDAKEELEARDYPRLRAVAGSAPITKKSGIKKVVLMRRACRPLLRNAVYHMARVALVRDEGIRERYHKLRSEGKTHGHALRIVGDFMLRALVSMLKYRTTWRSTTELQADKHSA